MFYNPDVIANGTPCKYGANIFQNATVNWRNEMDNHIALGPHDNTVFYDELTDASRDFFFGRDHVDNNIDTMDIMFLATHGIGWHDGYAYINMGLQLSGYNLDPNSDCLSGQVGEWNVGNNSVDYLDVFACNSLELANNGFVNGITTGLHQYHGHSGTVANGAGTEDKLDDYLDDAYVGSAAIAWVLELTSYDHWGDPADVCAVSLVYGNSYADADARIDYETYGGGSYARPTTDASMYIYLAACDPHDLKEGQMGTW